MWNSRLLYVSRRGVSDWVAWLSFWISLAKLVLGWDVCAIALWRSVGSGFDVKLKRRKSLPQLVIQLFSTGPASSASCWSYTTVRKMCKLGFWLAIGGGKVSHSQQAVYSPFFYWARKLVIANFLRIYTLTGGILLLNSFVVSSLKLSEQGIHLLLEQGVAAAGFPCLVNG